MKPSRGACAALLTAALAAAGCAQDDNPAAIAGPSPFVPISQVSGFWSGTLERDTVTGGECVGLDPSIFIPPVQEVTGVISQSGTDLTARLTSSTTGLACSYAGSGTVNSFVLDASTCDATVLVVRCEGEDDDPDLVREVRIVGSSITASVQGGAIVGRVAATYNVFDAETGVPVGGLRVTYNLIAARR